MSPTVPLFLTLLLSGCALVFSEADNAAADAGSAGAIDASVMDAGGLISADGSGATADCSGSLLINGSFTANLDGWGIAESTQATHVNGFTGKGMRICPNAEARAPYQLEVRSTLLSSASPSGMLVSGRARSNTVGGLPMSLFVLEQEGEVFEWGQSFDIAPTQDWLTFSAVFSRELADADLFTLAIFSSEFSAATTCIELDDFCVTPVP